MQAERCTQRTGSETPGGESPYSSLQKQDQKKKKKKKRAAVKDVESGEMSRGGHLVVSHTHQRAVGSEVACGSSGGTPKRGSDRCMPLTRIRA